eukprot:CAMPEP_0180091904 /NCGR_PEP_ID=MMETSP0985-20121206/24230_1 /TAXON_ID=483367 /ORGANISM="non described non described, Strain CCMP 2436" /LENGTH=110 /DNA_ID=CAMNT_0022026837 /DNA_START=162 /DNA_END=490 /DNA_ORIENTATION=+
MPSARAHVLREGWCVRRVGAACHLRVAPLAVDRLVRGAVAPGRLTQVGVVRGDERAHVAAVVQVARRRRPRRRGDAAHTLGADPVGAARLVRLDLRRGLRAQQRRLRAEP